MKICGIAEKESKDDWAARYNWEHASRCAAVFAHSISTASVYSEDVDIDNHDDSKPQTEVWLIHALILGFELLVYWHISIYDRVINCYMWRKCHICKFDKVQVQVAATEMILSANAVLRYPLQCNVQRV